MSYAAEQATIMELIRDNWAHTGVAYPNTQFEPAEADAYIRPVVRRQPAFNADISTGTNTVRHPGLLVIDIRVRENVGDGQAIDYADELCDLVRNLKPGSGIQFYAPTARPLGPVDGWYVWQVEAPFYRDTVLTNPN